jgi:peroxiredoxin
LKREALCLPFYLGIQASCFYFDAFPFGFFIFGLMFAFQQKIKFYSMKKLLAMISVFALSFSGIQAQEGVPSVKVQTLDGKSVNIQDYKNEGKPIIINFWATWCGPCKAELTTIHDIYGDWIEETGVQLIAVSIDDARTMSRVKPYVDTQGWEYEILLDPNGDLKRAMNVGNPPFTFLIDGTGKIVYKHTGYAPGDEEELYSKLKELTAK